MQQRATYLWNNSFCVSFHFVYSCLTKYYMHIRQSTERTPTESDTNTQTNYLQIQILLTYGFLLPVSALEVARSDNTKIGWKHKILDSATSDGSFSALAKRFKTQFGERVLDSSFISSIAGMDWLILQKYRKNKSQTFCRHTADILQTLYHFVSVWMHFTGWL